MNIEFDAQYYRKVSAMQEKWGKEIIQSLNLRGDESILDLGCGDGRLTAHLAQLVPRGQVLGLDASQNMIDLAQETEKPNLRFERFNINQMEMGGQYDLIFSNAALHWIRDHHSLFHRILPHLKPGGVLRLNFAGDGNSAHFFQVVRQLMKDPAFSAEFEHFEWPWFMPSPQEYRELVQAFPFKDFKVWGENRDHHFKDRFEMIGWLDQPSLVPFLCELPQQKRYDFRQRCIDLMIQMCELEDGSCFENFRRVNLWAKMDEAPLER